MLRTILKVRSISLILPITLFTFATSQALASKSFEEWIKPQKIKSLHALLTNISPSDAAKGVIVASPSKRAPNYYFHWIRDAGLVMDSLVQYRQHNGAQALPQLDALMDDYIRFSRRNQLTATMSGGLGDFFAGYGEPKFNVDGSAYVESWGRPQNDGPALRALALIHYAQSALSEGNSSVIDRIYSSSAYDSILKSDLEFVSHHWSRVGFDLWEELKGIHFYTELVQRRALIEGARIADLKLDPKAADWYRSQARMLETQIEMHWDAQAKFIQSTLNAVNTEFKPSNLDTSVILAAMHASGDDGYFAVTDDRVIATAQKIVERFQALYSINLETFDDEGMKLGTAVGRYPEDRYDGVSLSQGHAWTLLIAGMAEYNYRLAHAWQESGEIRITKLNAPYLKSISGFSPGLAGSPVLRKGTKAFVKVIAALRDEGDSYLRRLRHHTPDGSLSEQIHRLTGEMRGARDLTWSHASFLTAIQWR